MFVGLNHTFHISENEHIIDGINDFAEENNIDLVVMVPRMHSGFHNFFFEQNTKQMAFHTKVPLLALHKG